MESAVVPLAVMKRLITTYPTEFGRDMLGAYYHLHRLFPHVLMYRKRAHHIQRYLQQSSLMNTSENNETSMLSDEWTIYSSLFVTYNDSVQLLYRHVKKQCVSSLEWTKRYFMALKWIQVHLWNVSDQRRLVAYVCDL